MTYRREDVLRILHLQERQLLAWERAGLIALRTGDDTAADYTFEELGQLRTLRDLSATRLSVRSIRASVDAMQRVAGLANPLREVTTVQSGRRLTFRHAGALLDPLTQQLAFDFEGGAQRGLRVVRQSTPLVAALAGRRASELQELFLQAVQLEESADTVGQAATIYQSILDLEPSHAPAAINLGTIYYNRRDCARAEELYRRATISDPEYALAFFDLGNVLDELQRLDEAVDAYQRAVALVPQYADAHYNLALAYERMGHRRRALRHWQTYSKLDPTGPWSAHARGQAKKILSSEKLTVVTRHGRTMPARKAE